MKWMLTCTSIGLVDIGDRCDSFVDEQCLYVDQWTGSNRSGGWYCGYSAVGIGGGDGTYDVVIGLG